MATAAEETPDLTRLPKGVVPKRYELKFDVEPSAKKYTGLVNIRLYFEEDNVRTVWLHASQNVRIESAHVRFSQFGELPVQPADVTRVEEKDAVGVRFVSPVAKGTRAWLGIKFAGDVLDGMQGLFSTPYLDRNGERHLGAATMFAATEARTCFPCFDEPEFKAVFALEVTVDEHLVVISNMPVMDTKFKAVEGRARRKRTDYFEWTKEMSSYLVCFVIGDFEYLETKAGDHGRTRVRVYTPWGQREQGRFALQVAKKSLEFFNDYFGKRYPLPKLDLVALSRLSVGAMENWGVITCRETGMITDDKDSDPYSLQRVATLIAHEISHQWFGNLVTMKWWDNLYLNEGFATLMQYMCIDKLFPEYEVFNKFCSETVMPALGLDALQNSHPIEMPLEDSKEIAQVFDYITYSKGASVLFMLHEFIGANIFKQALQDYMDDFSYDNATTEELWGVLSAQSKKDVGSIMKSWIRELGFPIVMVSVSREPAENPEEVAVDLTQERFSSFSDSKANMVWSIPVRGIYMTKSGKLSHFDVLFDTPKTRVVLSDMSLEHPNCWLKLNPKMIGFYRVQYGETLFHRLLNNLSSEHLTPVDRIGLFDDQVAMVLSRGSSSTARLLKMVQLFKDFETSAAVWKAVIGALQQVRTLTWDNDELADQFDQFCLDVLKPVLDKTGVHPRHGEADNDAMLRASVFSMLAALGDPAVLQVGAEMFRAHADEVGPVPASLRGAVFRSVMAKAGMATLDQVLSLYRQTELAEDRVSILSALGCAEDPNVLARGLEFALSKEEVEPQEAINTMSTAAASRHGFRLMWSFFTQNVDRLVDTYIDSLFLFGRLVKSVTQSFADEEGGNAVIDFFADNEDMFEAQGHAVQQAVEHVKFNQIWRQQDVSEVHGFLEDYFNS